MLTLRQINKANTEKQTKLCWLLTKMLYNKFYYLALSASLLFSQVQNTLKKVPELIFYVTSLKGGGGASTQPW